MKKLRYFSFLKDVWLDNTKRPMMAMIAFVYLVTIWLQGPTELSKEDFSGYTIFMIFFMVLFVHKERLFRHRVWIYYIIQGLFVFNSALVMDVGFETVYIGLLPVLIYESMKDFDTKAYVLLVASLYYAIFTGLLLFLEGEAALKQYLPILGLVTFAVWMFNSMYGNQIILRVKSQKMARELEMANMKLETLTLERERERIARDLHDTLSQGLSALVLQLETAEIYLEKEKVDQAKEIVSKSSSHAKKTLAEARQVLKDLRQYSQEKQDLGKSLQIEIDQFRSLFDGEIEIAMNDEVQLDSVPVRQLTFIVREALINIRRHAKATQAVIYLSKTEKNITLKIHDNGIGFDRFKKWSYMGHFGLLGMEERVRSIGGEFKIFSSRRQGTTLEITLPIEEGGLSEW